MLSLTHPTEVDSALARLEFLSKSAVRGHHLILGGGTRMDVLGYASSREVKEVGLDVEVPCELLDQVTAWRFTQVMFQIVEIRCRDGSSILYLDARRQFALRQLGAFASFRDNLAECLHCARQPPGSIP